MKTTLLLGDCLEKIKELPDNSIDSVVTDPPYHLTSIVKRFGKEGSAPAQFGTDGAFARASKGFMGKEWDGGDIAFRPETWVEVLRVMKPGGHLLSFGATRNYHRMACAIEDAGFEIRDCIMWVYGSGFPKSHDISKGIDKAERGVPHGGADPTSPNHGKFKGGCSDDNKSGQGFGAGPGQFMREQGVKVERELSPTARQWEGWGTARQWEGWGTALKPAVEPIVMARKPLSEGTIVANVLKWGTGAINIDACRVPINASVDDPRLGGKGSWSTEKMAKNVYEGGYAGEEVTSSPLGRWPANLILDGSEEVVGMFPHSKGQQGDVKGTEKSNTGNENTVCYGEFDRVPFTKRNDSGSAARFFYHVKASKSDRNDGLEDPNEHPTVKPTKLMEYLCKLVTPPGGTVLDCFMGSGSTGRGALLGGFSFIGIEKDETYFKIAEKRIAAVQKKIENTTSLDEFFE